MLINKRLPSGSRFFYVKSGRFNSLFIPIYRYFSLLTFKNGENVLSLYSTVQETKWYNWMKGGFILRINKRITCSIWLLFLCLFFLVKIVTTLRSSSHFVKLTRQKISYPNLYILFFNWSLVLLSLFVLSSLFCKKNVIFFYALYLNTYLFNCHSLLNHY